VTAELVAVVRDGVLLALLLAAPVLVAALLAGLLTGLLAAVTQIQEPAVALLPRVAAIGVAIALFAPSIGHQLVEFVDRLWPLVASAGGAGGGSGG
jgi:flagellar biosynthetic protein FliQ